MRSIACVVVVAVACVLMPAARGCVCILDFDETLRICNSYGSCDSAPQDAVEVVKACRDSCRIGIASANKDRNKIESVLASSYGCLGVFTADFFSSPAFQFGMDDKAPLLRAIQQHYRLEGGSCMVLFDDMPHNGDYASQVGAQFVLVNPSSGVTKADYNKGMGMLGSNCFQTPPRVI